MKFDIDRAMALAASFDFPRGAGSEGEARAADLLAERLTKAGWKVARAETRTGFRMCTVFMILAILAIIESYLLWKALKLTLPGASRLVRGGLFVLGLAQLLGVLRLMLGPNATRIAWKRWTAWWRDGGPRRPVNLVAAWPSEWNPQARVLILTPLDAPLPLAGRVDWASCAVIVVLLVVTLARLPSVATAWIRVALVLFAACFLARYWLRVGQLCPGDNRSGLAILAELAEALSTRLHERVEIRLAAVGGSGLGQLGSLTLADDLRRHWPAKPTLAINLDAPGVGPDLVLAGGNDAVALARGSARDLWIPHRVRRWSLRALDHRPFLLDGFDAVSIAGHRDGDGLQPATLAATAQLVTEIALRWSRRHGEPAQPVTSSRSSQKPG